MATSRSALKEISSSNKNYSAATPSKVAYQTDVNETLDLLNELNTMMQKKDTVGEMREMSEKAYATQQMCNTQVMDSKEMLRQMGCRIQTLEAQLVPPPPDEECMKEIASIENKQKEKLGAISLIEEDMHNNEEEVYKLSNDIQQLQIEEEMSSEIQKSQVPKAEQAFNLFSRITSIRWDYSKTTRLAGVMNSETRAREFDIDPVNKTSCEVADELWDMIGSQFD